MKIHSCDCNFSHKPGEFGMRRISPYHFIGYFYTPFSYQVGNEMLLGNAGDVLIMPANTLVFHGPQNKNESFVNDWMFIEGNDFHKLLEQFPLPESQAFHIGSNSPLHLCIQQIRQELFLKQEGYEAIIDAKVTEAIVNIYRLYKNKNNVFTATARIEAARRTFLCDLSKHWTLKEMAELSGYSVSRFSSLYNQIFGLSPMADLLNNRIQHAKQLLNYSGLSVTAIAQQCGFQSIYYFSKYFKAATGVSPSEYVHRGISE